MKQRSRVSVTVDTSNQIIVTRLFSLRQAVDGLPDLIDHLKMAGQPWLYDAILDFRRYEAELTPDYLEFLVGKWISLEAGRRLRKILCVITPDLSLRAQLMPLADALPHRELAFFDTFDEAMDWIGERRQADAA